MNKNNKIKFLALSFVFFYSCSDGSEKMKYLICKDSVQYWNYNLTSDNQNVWFTFSFDKNGKVKKYSFYKNKRWLFEDYPRKTSLEWSVTKDSIFSFMGTSDKIIKISDDVISTIDLQTKEKHIYYRVKGNLNIQNPR